MTEPTPPVVQVVAHDLSVHEPGEVAPRVVRLVDLASRESEVIEAVDVASRILTRAADLATKERREGWRVAEVEATFTLTLGIEGRVVISRASAEASLEVRILVSYGA